MPSRTLLTVLLIIGVLFAVLIEKTPDKRTEVLPTPNISRKEAVGTAGYSARFHYPANAVWNKLVDFPTYNKWSASVRVDFNDYPLKVGSGGYIISTSPGKEPTQYPIEVLIFDHHAHILAWRGVMPVPEWLLVLERVQQVVDLPDQPGWCEYRSWDSWKGPMGYIVQWTLRNEIKEGVKSWVDEELTRYINSGDA